MWTRWFYQPGGQDCHFGLRVPLSQEERGRFLHRVRVLTVALQGGDETGEHREDRKAYDWNPGTLPTSRPTSSDES